jgi:hypothetical protein
MSNIFYTCTIARELETAEISITYSNWYANSTTRSSGPFVDKFELPQAQRALRTGASRRVVALL